MSDKLREVANYFISCANESNGRRIVTNKKLQKLAYYAQAWNLVFNDDKLFPEEIEAWIHGPAVPCLYRMYKTHGRMPINESVECDEAIFSRKEKRVLKDVWVAYGKFDGDYLEMLSHSEDPWIVARGKAESDENSNAIIDAELMKVYYREKNK